jgi:hypothetical protein
MRTIADQQLPVSQRVAAAEVADALAHQDLVQLLLQITADESESDEALRVFGSLLDRVTSTLELTEWDLRDMLEPAWDAYCG